MPAYTFEAIDPQGRPQKGLLEADTARAARAQLRSRQLIPLIVEPASPSETSVGTGWKRELWPKRAFSRAMLGVWTRQLAGLVGSGLPLERALSALADEAEEPAQQRLIASLRADVNAGMPLARALSQHPREFEKSYLAVIAAGEQSGQLDAVLKRLADDLEERDELRGKLIAASLYPAIVTVFATVIVLFLMTYVVPQVANAFAGGKRALPALTTVMLMVSRFIVQWWWLVAAALILAMVALLWARRQPALRERMDATWLRLPLVGRLARGYNAARFAATLAMLAGGGVPILKALQTAADTLHNQALRRDAQAALVLVREGTTLASALHTSGRFPALLTMFARLGEQTGDLPTMLQRAAEQLGAEVQRRAMRIATLLEPLLIVGMGLVVMLIVLAVMMPIIQLNQLVK